MRIEMIMCLLNEKLQEQLEIEMIKQSKYLTNFIEDGFEVG